MSTQTNSVRQHFQRHTGPYLLAGILLMSLLYMFYRSNQRSEAFNHRIQSLRQQVKFNQIDNDRRQLSLSMKTFTWAVRNAMLHDKSGEVNEYFTNMVQNKGIREILLVDEAGKVTLSTNKKNQGILFASRFPAYLLGKEDVYFNEKIPYELSAPINSSSKRLGTLVIFYMPTSVLPNALPPL